MFCVKCGTQIEEAALECPSCGAVVSRRAEYESPSEGRGGPAEEAAPLSGDAAPGEPAGHEASAGHEEPAGPAASAQEEDAGASEPQERHAELPGSHAGNGRPSTPGAPSAIAVQGPLGLSADSCPFGLDDESLFDLYSRGFRDQVIAEMRHALAVAEAHAPGFSFSGNPMCIRREDVVGQWEAGAVQLSGEDSLFDVSLRFFDFGIALLDLEPVSDSAREYGAAHGLANWEVRHGQLQVSLDRGLIGDLALMSADRDILVFCSGEDDNYLVARRVGRQAFDDFTPCIAYVGDWVSSKSENVRLELYRDGTWAFMSPTYVSSHSDSGQWLLFDDRVVCTYSDECKRRTGMEAEVFAIATPGVTLTADRGSIKIHKEGTGAHKRAKAWRWTKEFAEGFFMGGAGV